MSSGRSPRTQAILDNMWLRAYRRLWDQAVGETAEVVETHAYNGVDFVYRMYAVVRPFAKFNPATDTYDTGQSSVILKYAARLGRGGIVRGGFTVSTS